MQKSVKNKRLKIFKSRYYAKKMSTMQASTMQNFICIKVFLFILYYIKFLLSYHNTKFKQINKNFCVKNIVLLRSLRLNTRYTTRTNKRLFFKK